MVGSGSIFSGNWTNFDVVLKLNYPKNSSIFGSLIGGTLESLVVKDNYNYFEPIVILGLSHSPNYEYALVEKLNGSDCFLSGNGGGNTNTNSNINSSLSKLSPAVCFVLGGGTNIYELEYRSDCGSVNCNPFGRSIGYMPNKIAYHGVRCEQSGKLRMLLGFHNSSNSGRGEFLFDPNATLIAEGAWVEKENRFCGVACRILNVTDSWANGFVGDCSIRLILRFPAIMSLRSRSTVIGEIWSKKDVNDSSYFGKIGFQGGYWEGSFDPRVIKYEYTEIDVVRKSCAQGKTTSGKGKSYPDGYSSDMRFGMLVRDEKGKVALGFSSPLFVEDLLYERPYYMRPHVLGMPRLTEPAAVQLKSNHSRMNISYKMSFKPPPDFRFGGDASSEAIVSAEGIYDRDTGLLCMIGCRQIQSVINQILIKSSSLDCEIRINVQFPPLHAEHGEIVKGTIESIRAKSDPLYFERLQLSSNSITTTQAKESIWRMDLEITVVLISNTLACVFVGLQLFYVKKHPHVLPFISIVMLIVLMLGHMIPLLLNFEALFVANPNQTNVFLGSGGWLEVNEVTVRVVTMVAFLLQFRLLQLTWSARNGEGSQEGWWDSDRKVLYATLPLHIAGGLIAWFVHQWKNSHQRPLGPFLGQRIKHYNMHTLRPYQQSSFWEDIKSYAGLLLDGFLLPQILFNLFFNSGEKALASSFYIGATIVRLLPHAYDLYRAHSSTWYLDLSYIYANHRMDFYSTAWDIIIPCGGLLFAVLMFLQQRFGGRCILPKRCRENSVYEKVPVISNVEL